VPFTLSLADFEAARDRIAPHIKRTPLLTSAQLSERSGFDVRMKAELFQRVGSYKIRGPLNKFAQMPEELKRRGVVCSSAGNHAQGKTLEYTIAQGASGSRRARLAVQISEAAIALAAGQFQQALDSLLTLRQDFGLLGASHVQQDIYQQMMIFAALQLDDWARIRKLLKERRIVRFWNPASLDQLDLLALQIDKFETVEQVNLELCN
jgi:hypothetical protein